MAKKKGKSKPKKNRLEFAQIVQRYKSQDFAGAEKHLRKAYVKPHEKELALQLGAELTHRLSLQHIENWQFQAAIEILTSPNSKAAPSEMLAINKVLEGISQLYLGELEKAAAALAPAQESELTKKFHFYYLLALLYGGKYDSFDDFIRKHGNGLEDLKSRTEYLNAAFHLTGEAWREAAGILGNMAPLSETHGHQLSALDAILRQQQPENLPDPSCLAPLYKALLRLSLSETETAYLSNFAPLAALIESLQKQAQNRTLRLALFSLCEEGKPILSEVFQQCMQLAPDAQKPYLAYNQAANLFNENFEKNETAIHAVVREQSRWFFQAPESVFLLLKMLFFDANSFPAKDVYEYIDRYLTGFGKLLPFKVLENIGWQSWEVLKFGDMNWDIQAKKLVEKWVAQYPGISAFRFLLLDLSTRGAHTQGQVQKPIDLFSLPVSKDKTRKLLDLMKDRVMDFSHHEILGLIEKMLPFGKDILNEAAASSFQAYLDIIPQSVLAFPPPPGDTFALDIFSQLAHSYRKFDKKGSNPISPKQHDQFVKAWHSTLEHLGEATPESPYQEEYLEFTDKKTAQKISQLTGTEMSETKLAKSFSDLIKAGKAKSLANAILRKIDERHFAPDLEGMIEIFFNQLIKEKPEAAKTVAASFFKKFNDLKADDPCDCGNEMLFSIINFLLPAIGNLESSHQVAYQAGLALNNWFIDSQDEFPLLAFHFLKTCQWLQKNDPGFLPNAGLAKQLVAHVEKNIPVIKNKKLSTQAEAVCQFFNASK